MILWIAAIMIIFSLFIVMFPLQNTLNKTDKLVKKYSMSTIEVEMMDNKKTKINQQDNNGMIIKNQKQINTIDQFETFDKGAQ